MKRTPPLPTRFMPVVLAFFTLSGFAQDAGKPRHQLSRDGISVGQIFTVTVEHAPAGEEALWAEPAAAQVGEPVLARLRTEPPEVRGQAPELGKTVK